MNNASAVQQDNVGKLRPFDATKCKPGDPVVRVRNGVAKQARFVAYVEDANPDFCAIILDERRECITFTADGRLSRGLDPEIFLPPLDPLDEVDPSPGNVDKLTRRQVGEGYRIPAHDEPAPGGEDMWLPNSRRWTSRTFAGNRYCEGTTYRVPIAPAMVPLDQSDIVLGKTVVRISDCPERSFLVCGVNGTGVFVLGYSTVREWGMLQNGWEISFDHGVTWQKAEKKGKEPTR